MMVLAGAVAVAMAPRSREKSHSIWNRKCIARVMATPAARDSQRVIRITFRPVLRMTSRRKYFPTLKAIKESAISLKNPIWAISSAGTRFNTWGLKSTPAMI